MDAFRVFLAVFFVLGAISAYKTGIVHSHQKDSLYCGGYYVVETNIY